MRILVIGDPYLPTDVFRSAFGALEEEHTVRYVQLEGLDPVGEPSLGIREYLGSPTAVSLALEDDDVLIVHGAPIDEATMASGSGLSLIGCARGGPVNVDVAAATLRGIPVLNTPGKNAEAVADLTLAFLIALARRLPHAMKFVQDGGTTGASAFEGVDFFGGELGGHTLGLVGWGHVGRRVATRATAFGMTVLVHDPYVEQFPFGVEPLNLDELLARSDFVSLHARATPETDGLFDAERFARMRPGALFVNTARETLVDEVALLNAITAGHIAGAALDVLRPRSDRSRHPLLDAPNVLVTPHLGGATHETLARGAAMLADDVARVAQGIAPSNLFNPEVLADHPA